MRQGIFGIFELFLLGALLCVDERARTGLVNTELVSSDNCLLTRSYGQSFSYARGISKLNEAELVFSTFIGVASTVANTEIENDATLFVIFEELFETTDVDFADWVDPDSTISLFLVQVLHAFQQVNSYTRSLSLL